MFLLRVYLFPCLLLRRELRITKVSTQMMSESANYKNFAFLRTLCGLKKSDNICVLTILHDTNVFARTCGKILPLPIGRN